MTMKFTPRKAIYKGKELLWKKPKKLYHVTDTVDVPSILKYGLLAEKPIINPENGEIFTQSYWKQNSDKEIYLFSEKVPFSEMTGRKVIGYFTILEIDPAGVSELDIDLDPLGDPEWHKTHSDKYPEFQYIAKQKLINHRYIKVVTRYENVKKRNSE